LSREQVKETRTYLLFDLRGHTSYADIITIMLVGFWNCVEEKYTDNGLRDLVHGAYYIAHSSRTTSRRLEPYVLGRGRWYTGTPIKKRRKIYNNNVLVASSLNSCKCQRRTPIHYIHTNKMGTKNVLYLILYGILLNSIPKLYKKSAATTAAKRNSTRSYFFIST